MKRAISFLPSRWRIFAVAAVVAATAMAMPATELRPFTATSFAAIRAANEERCFLVAFWSIACEPCKQELVLLTRLHRDYPTVPIVLVAADSPERRSSVLRFLNRYDWGKIETWQFSDEPEERLRYAVDRTWRGELPRAYLFDANGERTVRSGLPDERWLAQWFARASAPDRPPPPAKAPSARQP